VPVIWLAPPGTPSGDENEVFPARQALGPVVCHPNFATDVALVRGLLGKNEAAIDLAEPFARIREAIGEARKTGVTARSSAA
jgi:hypothetical protein